MAKSSKIYSCQSCGGVSSKWAGKCEACGAWNSMQEEIVEAGPAKSLAASGGVGGRSRKGTAVSFVDLQGKPSDRLPRLQTGMAELDRVTGGGLVPGSALLIGGDPGIGKSTLLLQAVCRLAQSGCKCAYVSGEEAVDQVRMRSRRLGLEKSPVQLAAATNVRDIIASMEEAASSPETKMDVIVIDSIQTMFVDTVESAPGTVTQVRMAAQELMKVAKRRNITILLVGHVTKEGQIAGPRVLEHMVDAVLYFEGERGHQFRILRTVKNRFGPTDEIGVFEMAAEGLVEVANPSEIFLAQRQDNVPGSAVLAGLEGTRPVLVEVQALVAPSAFGTPRRAVIGWDSSRLAMVLAVLEARCGLVFSSNDIFLNIAGGIRISEPAADLAVAAALVSSHSGKAIPSNTVFFGEIGLAGEIRSVAQPDLRLKEASKLGFERALIPPMRGKKKKQTAPSIMTCDEIAHMDSLLDTLTTRFVHTSPAASNAA